MNMDQVLVLTYTDRNHKTRVIADSEFYEMFVCENSRGRCLNDEEEWLESFTGEFNYITFYQAVIEGGVFSDDFQEISEILNRHWTTRNEKGVSGVYGFVNAGVLDHRMFNEHTFDVEPSDFKMWLDERREAHAILNERKIAKLKSGLAPTADKPKVVNERKSWLL